MACFAMCLTWQSAHVFYRVSCVLLNTSLLQEGRGYSVLTYFCTFHILYSTAIVQRFDILSSSGNVFFVSTSICIVDKPLGLLVRGCSKRWNDVFSK